MSILKSRKFWLAVVGVIQTVVLYYVDVPKDIWMSINILIGVVIAGIAIEDAGQKSAGGY